MQRLDDMAFRTLYSSASSASAASKQLLEHGLSKLKAGHTTNTIFYHFCHFNKASVIGERGATGRRERC